MKARVRIYESAQKIEWMLNNVIIKNEKHHDLINILEDIADDIENYENDLENDIQDLETKVDQLELELEQVKAERDYFESQTF